MYKKGHFYVFFQAAWTYYFSVPKVLCKALTISNIQLNIHFLITRKSKRVIICQLKHNDFLSHYPASFCHIMSLMAVVLLNFLSKRKV